MDLAAGYFSSLLSTIGAVYFFLENKKLSNTLEIDKREAELIQKRLENEILKKQSELKIAELSTQANAASEAAATITKANETAIKVSSTLQQLIEGQIANIDKFQKEANSDISQKKIDLQEKTKLLRQEISALEATKTETQVENYRFAISELKATLIDPRSGSAALPSQLLLLRRSLRNKASFDAAKEDLKTENLAPLVKFKLALEMALLSNSDYLYSEAKRYIRELRIDSGNTASKAIAQGQPTEAEQRKLIQFFGEIYATPEASETLKLNILFSVLTNKSLSTPSEWRYALGDDLYLKIIKATGELYLSYSKRRDPGYYEIPFCKQIGDSLFEISPDGHHIYIELNRAEMEREPGKIIYNCISSQKQSPTTSEQEALRKILLGK